MNIFILDNNPKIAAQMLCDKHVVKMIVETAQMLCTTASKLGHDDVPYKPTHFKHPCTLWAGESSANWDWLIAHGIEMCAEYTRRYNRIHKTQAVIEWCKSSNVGPVHDFGLTPFRLAMPEQYKCDDPVKSYRDYYIGEKSRFARWKTSEPVWWPFREGQYFNIATK
jgi:hypothetical protein|tara:strand:- start:1617 stop:2117 length:501 start_codon:yes stop_codon:yes gene_type:complete